MKIVNTQFNLEYNALEIYISGCNQHCKGCHNPELQSFNIGENWKNIIDSIVYKINEFNNIIDNIWLLGGEWLDQDIIDVVGCISELNKTNQSIWLFTGYNLDDVDNKILNLVDYVKVGKYDETKLVDDNIQYGIKLASSNQKITKISK